MSSSMRAVGRLQETVGLLDEAAGLFRPLAEKDPATYAVKFADILRTAAMTLRQLGDEAGARAREAEANSFDPLPAL